MKSRLLIALALFFAAFAYSATPTPIVGVVLESGSDLPLDGVQITYRSGKKLGKTSSDGRFELTVDSKKASLVFSKEGYDSVYVDLQDFADLLDMVVTLSSDLRDLGASTIVGGGEPVKWEPERKVSVDKLEDAAGMRFDVTEHLGQMPGISGQKDFSNALYYEGSRAGDVAYHLGRLRIPNMRHLDVGFPGNLSVVNPHVLSGIEIHDHYGSGPIGQGLATSVQYLPEQTKGGWGLKGTASLTLREIQFDSPFLFWDSFRFAFRLLDAEVLKNLGEKFFTEFKKRDGDCADDCRVKSADPFDLNAKDFYAQLNGSDSMGNTWALRALYSDDEYSISQDSSTSYDEVSSVDIIKGSQEYLVIGAEYASKFGTSLHAGYVRQYLSDTLQDTTGFRRNAMSKEAAAFIDAYEEIHSTISAGADKNFKTKLLGSNVSGALLYEHHLVERNYPDFGGTQSSDYQTGVLSGTSRFNWKTDYSQTIFSLGAIADAVDHNAQPTASVDFEKNLSEKDSTYWRAFGNVAYRSDWKHYYDDGDLTGRLETGASAKFGVGYNSKYLIAQASGFGRYYFDPLLPMPKAYAQYKDITPVDYAWVLGANAKVDWKTSHHFSMSTNISSVYGEYELDEGSLPWEANSRLDIVSHFRYYPRKDSLFSIILTHHAALHRPLYYYNITPSYTDVSGKEAVRYNGTRRLRDLEEFTDMFRTDIRVNLDIYREKGWFRKSRFYLEIDNLFANVDVGALRFLGSENARERSWVVEDKDKNTENGFDLKPFMAKGMGLWFEFGIEVMLGI